MTDGAQMWGLTARCSALDLNSPYSYLLMCRHFAQTCLVAESQGTLVGFVTGYHPPGRNDTIFVWQIAVAPESRRSGLGRRLIDTLLDRLVPTGVRFLEATVAPKNQASLNLFRSVARDHGVHYRESVFFEPELFDSGELATPHETEILLQLGPFNRAGIHDGDREKGADVCE